MLAVLECDDQPPVRTRGNLGSPRQIHWKAERGASGGAALTFLLISHVIEVS